MVQSTTKNTILMGLALLVFGATAVSMNSKENSAYGPRAKSVSSGREDSNGSTESISDMVAGGLRHLAVNRTPPKAVKPVSILPANLNEIFNVPALPVTPIRDIEPSSRRHPSGRIVTFSQLSPTVQAFVPQVSVQVQKFFEWRGSGRGSLLIPLNLEPTIAQKVAELHALVITTNNNMETAGRTIEGFFKAGLPEELWDIVLRACDGDGRAALQIAALHGNTEAMLVLLRIYGQAALNVANRRHLSDQDQKPLRANASKLRRAAFHRKNVATGKSLMQYTNVQKDPLLHQIVKISQPGTISQLLNQFEGTEYYQDIIAVLDAKNGRGETAFDLAMARKNNCREILLSYYRCNECVRVPMREVKKTTCNRCKSIQQAVVQNPTLSYAALLSQHIVLASSQSVQVEVMPSVRHAAQGHAQITATIVGAVLPPAPSELRSQMRPTSQKLPREQFFTWKNSPTRGDYLERMFLNEAIYDQVVLLHSLAVRDDKLRMDYFFTYASMQDRCDVLSACDQQGRAALQIAALHGNVNAMSVILKAYFYENSTKTRAAMDRECREAFNRIDKDGLSCWKYVDDQGNTILHNAVMQQCLEAMKLFLKNIHHVDYYTFMRARNNSGESVLAMAIRLRNKIFIEELVRAHRCRDCIFYNRAIIKADCVACDELLSRVAQVVVDDHGTTLSDLLVSLR